MSENFDCRWTWWHARSLNLRSLQPLLRRNMSGRVLYSDLAIIVACLKNSTTVWSWWSACMSRVGESSFYSPKQSNLTKLSSINLRTQSSIDLQERSMIKACSRSNHETDTATGGSNDYLNWLETKTLLLLSNIVIPNLVNPIDDYWYTDIYKLKYITLPIWRESIKPRPIIYFPVL